MAGILEGGIITALVLLFPCLDSVVSVFILEEHQKQGRHARSEWKIFQTASCTIYRRVFFGWIGVGGERGIHYSISTAPFLRGLEGFSLS